MSQSSVAGHPLRPATVVALVSRYLTNKLIGREPIYNHYITLSTNTPCGDWSYPVLDPVSQAYPRVKGRLLVLLTRSPLIHLAS